MDDEEERIVTLVANLSDNKFVVRHRDGSFEILENQTNWERLKTKTDEDIERAIADDPDWDDFKNLDWSKAKIVAAPNKIPISIRLDDDVLNFFKREGAGYQKRINAVLRSYMNAKA
jgi:uncharacterized protein (DUF4415 family)